MRKKIKPKVLFVGSTTPAHHGQAAAFLSAIRGLRHQVNGRILETSFKSDNVLKSIYLLFKFFFLTVFYRLFFRPRYVYFLCSRTRIGFIRDFWFLLLFRFSKARIVNHLHGNSFDDFYNGQGKLLQKLIRWSYGRVDHFIVLHKAMVNQFDSVRGDTPISVVENFVLSVDDVDRILESSKDVSGQKNPLKIIYLSTIRAEKGIYYLLDAVKQLNRDGIQTKLDIYGDIFGHSKSEREAEEKKFNSEIQSEAQIQYKGLVMGKQKFVALAQADVFALPTYFHCEAIPLAILEALYMGCFILATRHNLLPELVSEASGVLVEKESSEAIYQALKTLDQDREYLKKVQAYNYKTFRDQYNELRYQIEVRKILLNQDTDAA